MRVALYARVSTDEQAKHGLSIDTQLANLREWAKKNGHIIVKEYVDPGISGKKPPSKRPDLSRFFDDLEQGLSVDALVFTKLDRFFRSVKLYYQAVAMLEKHSVAWVAIQEDYETISSAGRFKVNIMLSIAEAEADRTSERIKVVFAHKVAMGESLSPCSLPLGYKVKDKKVVPDENAEAVRAAFNYYLACGSIKKTMKYLSDTFGITILYKPLATLLHNALYIGKYRENESYCEPIIDRGTFLAVQESLKNRSVRDNQSKREYVFSGLLKCADCGRNLIANSNGQGYFSYRCQRAELDKQCGNHKSIGEPIIERELIKYVRENMPPTEVEKTPQKKKVDPAGIQEKLDRLSDLYVEGLISKEKYLADREAISKPLLAPPQPRKKDTEIFTAGDFESRYKALSPSERRAVWRSIIDYIEIDAQGNMRVIFKP